jgi:hypothetical protein
VRFATDGRRARVRIPAIAALAKDGACRPLIRTDGAAVLACVASTSDGGLLTHKPSDRIGRRRPTIFGLFLLVVLMAAGPLAAQGDTEWTVVTLARAGSWGVGHAELQGPAIATALRKCNAMSRKSDCGAEFTAVRRGWTLGILCGDHRVLVAARELATAEREAQARESYLRTLYGESLPGCWRVMTVDPDGFVIKARPPGIAKIGQGR